MPGSATDDWSKGVANCIDKVLMVDTHFSSDESSCPSDKRPNIRLRLSGGRSANEGRVEVKAFDYGFGGICDDGFKIEEANVVCR